MERALGFLGFAPALLHKKHSTPRHKQRPPPPSPQRRPLVSLLRPYVTPLLVLLLAYALRPSRPSPSPPTQHFCNIPRYTIAVPLPWMHGPFKESPPLLGPLDHPAIFTLHYDNEEGGNKNTNNSTGLYEGSKTKNTTNGKSNGGSGGAGEWNGAFRESSSYEALLASQGALPVLLTSSNSYSQGRRSSTLGAYLTSHSQQFTLSHTEGDEEKGEGKGGGAIAQRHTEEGKGGKANESFYLFGNHHGVGWSSFLSSYVLPPCRTCQEPSPSHPSNDQAAALSFGIGWAHSGVAWHKHGPGYSEVLWGSKRWLLYPPHIAPPGFHPNMSTLQWVNHILPSLASERDRRRDLSSSSLSSDSKGDGEREAPSLFPNRDQEGEGEGDRGGGLWDCVIGPGEVLYFPPMWMHATLNLSPYTAFVSTFLTHE